MNTQDYSKMPRGETVKKKSAKKKPTKLRRRQKAIKLLDRVYSVFIRIRDSENGKCQCVTCGSQILWHESKKINCGHFVKRDKYPVRWEEKNTHAQCVGCNKYRDGEQYIHGKKIDDMYGDGTADELVRRGHQDKGPYVHEIEEMIPIYIEKVRALVKENNYNFDIDAYVNRVKSQI